MKTKIITVAIILFSLVSNVMGQEGKYNLGRGYRGFVEVDKPLDYELIFFSTTHGYQFNPHIFAGAGVTYMVSTAGDEWNLNANVRIDATSKGKFIPFLDVKTYIKDDYLFNIHPSIGCRFNHINVKAGYWKVKDAGGIFTIGIGFDFGGRKKK